MGYGGYGNTSSGGRASAMFVSNSGNAAPTFPASPAITGNTGTVNLATELSTNPNYSILNSLASQAFGAPTLGALLSQKNISIAAPTNSAFTTSVVNFYKTLTKNQQQNLLLNHLWVAPASQTSGANQTYVLSSLGTSSLVVGTDANGQIVNFNGVDSAGVTQLLTNGGSLTPITSVLTQPVQLLGNCSCS